MPFDALVLGGVAAAFLAGFPAMVSIVNPVGNALTFLSLTADRTRAERVVLARRIGLYSLAILLGSIWLGSPVLAFFGVSVGVLRVAGGLAVAVQAWAMLMAPDPSPDRREGDETSRPDLAFFPLTMPLTAGPGSIAVAIALGSGQAPAGAGRIGVLGGTTLAALAIAALVWAIYASADRVARLVGPGGERVLGRLMAFLLLCIGVQMLWTGIEDLIGPWLVGSTRAINAIGPR